MSEVLCPPTSAAAAPEFQITPELLQRFDVAGPRYTSYPTADRFVEAFGEVDYAHAARLRVQGAAAAPLSVYVHIPFCESVCYYCACNKVVTKDHGRSTAYLDALEKEMALHTALLGVGQSVSQLHLGGGTPTFLNDGELSRLLAALRHHFKIAPGAEMSIEVDPRTVTRERLQHLAQLGFNRLSFGVQDFDEDVQRAVHRVQSFESVRFLIEAAREIGFESVNVDLIYGLPKQNPVSFAKTVAQVNSLRPDRIALYSYAHLPQRFKPQRRISTEELPAAGQKVGMLSNAIAAFLAAGYVYIGMDHFALPDDALAVAKRQGRLHRNFQGYSTQPDCDLVALGVSAIGHIGATYSQNAKTLPEYYDALAQGQLPIVRGLALTRDDLVRRAVIMALMCQGRLEFESIELSHLVDVREYFRSELAQMEALAEQGLVEIEPNALQVTRMGWYFVRAVAMVFDRHLQADRQRERFSRII
ncbi:oxygen-independent coproporphyrinogen III oxidase [Piscinibacter gummiphilus]|uniref:Coproporphyrinogen-III oxidase n=1 Tax=Piscinibacter gummiphilus TaxID=946333 RepID=A0ABZ0CM40_9BURK|nr:oxygen-independent coproporphyrinogen III oxidase [Piscinibacter gummiphilus]WOB06046.1 oxygen-independent coproporphyrinogen III oxidase [Piscinibacter gummiphilus]